MTTMTYTTSCWLPVHKYQCAYQFTVNKFDSGTALTSAICALYSNGLAVASTAANAA
jgi:hypothetical protein